MVILFIHCFELSSIVNHIFPPFSRYGLLPLQIHSVLGTIRNTWQVYPGNFVFYFNLQISVLFLLYFHTLLKLVLLLKYFFLKNKWQWDSSRVDKHECYVCVRVLSPASLRSTIQILRLHPLCREIKSHPRHQ